MVGGFFRSALYSPDGKSFVNDAAGNHVVVSREWPARAARHPVHEYGFYSVVAWPRGHGHVMLYAEKAGVTFEADDRISSDDYVRGGWRRP